MDFSDMFDVEVEEALGQVPAPVPCAVLSRRVKQKVSLDDKCLPQILCEDPRRFLLGFWGPVFLGLVLGSSMLFSLLRVFRQSSKPLHITAAYQI